MASKVALDLLYWAMRLALFRLSRMAIEMAREAGALFSVFCRQFYVMHNRS